MRMSLTQTRQYNLQDFEDYKDASIFFLAKMPEMREGDEVPYAKRFAQRQEKIVRLLRKKLQGEGPFGEEDLGLP